MMTTKLNTGTSKGCPEHDTIQHRTDGPSKTKVMKAVRSFVILAAVSTLPIISLACSNDQQASNQGIAPKQAVAAIIQTATETTAPSISGFDLILTQPIDTSQPATGAFEGIVSGRSFLYNNPSNTHLSISAYTYSNQTDAESAYASFVGKLPYCDGQFSGLLENTFGGKLSQSSPSTSEYAMVSRIGGTIVMVALTVASNTSDPDQAKSLLLNGVDSIKSQLK
jgi:hypothetical protein